MGPTQRVVRKVGGLPEDLELPRQCAMMAQRSLLVSRARALLDTKRQECPIAGLHRIGFSQRDLVCMDPLDLPMTRVPAKSDSSDMLRRHVL